MAQQTVDRYTVSMKFAIGQSESGATKTMSVSIGSLSTDGYDKDKAFALAASLSSLYSEVMQSITETTVARLTA